MVPITDVRVTSIPSLFFLRWKEWGRETRWGKSWARLTFSFVLLWRNEERERHMSWSDSPTFPWTSIQSVQKVTNLVSNIKFCNKKKYKLFFWSLSIYYFCFLSNWNVILTKKTFPFPSPPINVGKNYALCSIPQRRYKWGIISFICPLDMISQR